MLVDKSSTPDLLCDALTRHDLHIAHQMLGLRAKNPPISAQTAATGATEQIVQNRAVALDTGTKSAR
jgi:hypothetical protein